jgi:hypothetical protein
MTVEKFDVYTHVTNQIVAQIEAGTPPWRKPWTGGGVSVSLPERFNGETYRGINILMLWAEAMVKGYSSARWMTFNQAKQLGGMSARGKNLRLSSNTAPLSARTRMAKNARSPMPKPTACSTPTRSRAYLLNSTSCPIRPVIWALEKALDPLFSPQPRAHGARHTPGRCFGHV